MEPEVSGNLACLVFDDIMVVVHANAPPTDEGWARMLLIRDLNRPKLRGMLVVAPPKATISLEQRKDVYAFLKETGSRISVLSDSAAVRVIASTVGLLGVKVRAFDMKDLKKALDYIGADSALIPDVLRQIGSMRLSFPPSAEPNRP